VRVFRFDVRELFGEDEIKCGGCNWPTTVIYVIASSQEEARNMILNGHAGLCGSCFAEMLAESDLEIQ